MMLKTSSTAAIYAKQINQQPGGLLHSLPIPDIPWESISTDLIISLPLTTTGFDAILVWVDRLTKMVHLCPALTSIGAEQWAMGTRIC